MVLLILGHSNPRSLDLVSPDVSVGVLCLSTVDMFSMDSEFWDSLACFPALEDSVYFLEFGLQVIESLYWLPECQVYLGDLKNFQVQ